ncbi:MAG: hypothetical protein HYZ42_02305 [Bacteroidetes bacterium]|nr:hypothetical protein [Bacteroidota bacterium]
MHNCVSFDGVPVYHPYHLLGVYSVFDHVNAQSVTYTRSNFDARYNGLSSQVAVKSKEIQGVNNGSISYDILFLKASLETKIDKNSVLVASVRRSYLDALLNGLSGDSSTLKPVVHDFSIKYIYKLKSGSLLQFNTLQTGDVLKTGEVKTIIDDQGNSRKRDRGFDIGLRNSLYNAQLTRILRGQSLESFQAYYTSYTFKTEYHSKIFVSGASTPEEAYYLTKQNGIKDIALRYTLSQAKRYNSNLTIGGLVGMQMFDVGTMTYKRDVVDLPTFDSLYFKNRPTFINTSLFASGYMPYKGYMLNYTAKATLLAGYSTFFYVDPRFTIQKFIDSTSNIEFSYDVTHQPYHILSENNYGFGFDNIVPSSKFAPVQRMQQISLSYMKKIKARYVFNSSIYYRNLAHQVLLVPGQNSEIASKSWDDKMYKGKGNIFGLELQLKKTEGLTTGWIAYTYTYSRRTFSALNEGESFPYFTDRNHELDFVVINKIGKRNYFTFCYSILSGNPITSPTSKYQLPVASNFSGNWTGQGVSVKGGINNYRTFNVPQDCGKKVPSIFLYITC